VKRDPHRFDNSKCFLACDSAMNSDDEEEGDVQQKQFKVILLGDGAVGKTSIAKRFSQGTWSTECSLACVRTHLSLLPSPAP
jgi:GTPase SAR1 family protein